jgi:hypothetical protein
MTRILASLMLLPLVAATAAETGDQLVTATSDGSLLNVTIPVFDPGIPEDPAVYREQQVFPRIREIEAKLLPFLLRETLVGSGQWGAVRVTTTPEAAAELQVFGTIVRSDGDSLDLHIRVVDATGETWFDQVFSGHAGDEGRGDNSDAPEFQALYDQIAGELVAARERAAGSVVSTIKGTSLMRYASQLAPTAFSEFIEERNSGQWRLLRLPARNDPMLGRIERIRNTEFLITDTVDTKYRELNSELARTYRIWREYRRKFVEYEAEDLRFAESRYGEAPRGSWDAIKHQYDAYKYNRITAQEQDRLAIAFNNEVAATVEAMEDRVAELEGWVEKGYVEWHRLLEDLHEVETYLLEN